jgi:hypothetical protein
MNQEPTKMKRITQLFCLLMILLMTNCQVEEDVANPELSTNREELFSRTHLKANRVASKEIQ